MSKPQVRQGNDIPPDVWTTSSMAARNDGSQLAAAAYSFTRGLDGTAGVDRLAARSWGHVPDGTPWLDGVSSVHAHINLHGGCIKCCCRRQLQQLQLDSEPGFLSVGRVIECCDGIEGAGASRTGQIVGCVCAATVPREWRAGVASSAARDVNG